MPMLELDPIEEAEKFAREELGKGEPFGRPRKIITRPEGFNFFQSEGEEYCVDCKMNGTCDLTDNNSICPCSECEHKANLLHECDTCDTIREVSVSI